MNVPIETLETKLEDEMAKRLRLEKVNDELIETLDTAIKALDINRIVQVDGMKVKQMRRIVKDARKEQ